MVPIKSEFANVMGSDVPAICPDCLSEVPKVLEQTGSWLSVWVSASHDCGARQRRLSEEAEARQMAERETKLHPSTSRKEALRKDGNLPWWAPLSLDDVRAGEAWETALAKLQEHADIWLSGQVPVNGLWLCGSSGLRKTCATAALAGQVANWTGQPTWFQNIEDLMDQRAAAARDEPNQLAATRAKMAGAKLLVLDDLFTAGITEPLWRTLYNVTERAASAWGQTRPPQTIYCSSNESPEAIRLLLNQRLGGADRDNPGNRLVRRLKQLCEVVLL